MVTNQKLYYNATRKLEKFFSNFCRNEKLYYFEDLNKMISKFLNIIMYPDSRKFTDFEINRIDVICENLKNIGNLTCTIDDEYKYILYSDMADMADLDLPGYDIHWDKNTKKVWNLIRYIIFYLNCHHITFK